MNKRQAIIYFKTQAEIARVLNITRQAVNKWPDVVPIKQAWKLEKASKGAVKMRLSDYR